MTSLGPIKREDLNDFIVSSSITVQYGFITGFLLGGYAAGQRASLQFLAENQHEAPRNRAQALQYHRNKNYKMMAAFVSGGIRRGIQLGAVAVAYSIIKKGLEGGRFREIKGLVQLNGHFDDFIAGSLVGSSFFLVSNPKQRIFHFKKGLLLGSTLGASLSLLKFISNNIFNKNKVEVPYVWSHGSNTAQRRLQMSSSSGNLNQSASAENISQKISQSQTNLNASNSSSPPPPSSSNLSTFVHIEAVHLLIHSQQNPSQIYRKLLAPEPTLKSMTTEHFIKTIRLIENCSFQFEFDFKIVQSNGTSPQTSTSTSQCPEISLFFHEILQEGRKTCNFYLENMGRFIVTPLNNSYRYTTTLSGGYPSRFGLKSQSIRLEIVDLDRTAWFIGEWKVKFQSISDFDNWLAHDFNGTSPITSNNNEQLEGRFCKDDNLDLDTLNLDVIVADSQQMPNSILKIPSSFPSRTSSPLSQSSLQSDEPNRSNSNNSRLSDSPVNNSLSASFEELDLSDFTDIEASNSNSLTLPNETCTLPARLLFSNDELPPAGEQRRLSRPTTPNNNTMVEVDDLSTVDILHQVGTNLFSTRLGQFMTSSIKRDPNEQNLKNSYSTSTIHLLGTRYQLQGLNSNVLLMESENKTAVGDGIDEDVIINYIERFNNFSFLLKRLKFPNSSRLMVLREVLLLKRAGPIISSRLKNWFEASFSQHWSIQAFTPATLKVASNGIVIEVNIYSLKPNESSPLNSPELFLVELLLSQSLHSSVANAFYSIAEANAFFVELTAFIVQMEVSEAKKAPEIVLMETLNAHTESEQLSQSISVPIVKISAIPESNSPFNSLVYFWSDHLQGWLLQNLGIEGMILSIHPLLDAKMAIQINLSGSHLKASQDKDGKIGNFTLISSRGQVFNFRTVYGGELKEIIGRIRFALLLRGTRNVQVTAGGRSRRQASLLQADKIYRGSLSSNNTDNGNNLISEEELERIRTQNMTVMDSFLEDFRTRFWFTYRRNFPRIEPSLFTTDLGWGCMLRTGQCLMAEALARFYFGRNWRLWQLKDDLETLHVEEGKQFEKIKIIKQFHTKIMNQFIDQAKGEYSVHRLAMEGAKIGTPIGQWFGPSIIGKVLKSITNNSKDSPFWVYYSSDGSFPTSHLLKIVSQRAALILLPLRLGIDSINPIYGQFIRGALRSSSSLGIVGGLPDKSLYFVGYQDWELFFLDPHILKQFDPASFQDANKLIEDYHTGRVRSISIEEIDPSMLFGFLCCSAEEIVQLRDHLIKLNSHANILSIKID